MNCADVKDLLSAYYDAELSADVCAEISEHLKCCSECCAEHSGFEQLTDMVQCLATPAPSQLGWQQLQERLDGEPTIDTAERTLRKSWFGFRVPRPVLAVAALLLVAVGWFAIDTWLAPGSHNLLAADFQQYLSEFEHDPDVAQRELISKYSGEGVDLAQAVQRVSYQPAAAELPSAYKLDSMYLLRMPCCDCLQTVCQRSDGSKIVIFEYGEEQPLSLGERTGGMDQCRGKNCCLVQINEQFAENTGCLLGIQNINFGWYQAVVAVFVAIKFDIVLQFSALLLLAVVRVVRRNLFVEHVAS